LRAVVHCRMYCAQQQIGVIVTVGYDAELHPAACHQVYCMPATTVWLDSLSLSVVL
jgi:hypothetical protein